MIAAIDWNAVGAIATISAALLGILGGLAKWIISEVRKTQTTATENAAKLDTITNKVTTPDTVSGTIGQTVASMAVDQAEHFAADEERFGALWQELGKNEPKGQA